MDHEQRFGFYLYRRTFSGGARESRDAKVDNPSFVQLVVLVNSIRFLLSKFNIKLDSSSKRVKSRSDFYLVNSI